MSFYESHITFQKQKMTFWNLKQFWEKQLLLCCCGQNWNLVEVRICPDRIGIPIHRGTCFTNSGWGEKKEKIIAIVIFSVNDTNINSKRILSNDISFYSYKYLSILKKTILKRQNMIFHAFSDNDVTFKKISKNC